MSYSVRHPMSKRDRRELVSELRSRAPALARVFEEATKVERAKLKGGCDVILADGLPVIVYLGGEPVPTLAYFLKHGVEGFPVVVVDAGAVPHILNGADVMRPGIVEIRGDFAAGDVVVVLEERGYPIAVCRALHASDEVRAMRRGKVLKNVHYLRDRLWRQLFRR
ncbi:MAG: pseudouridine synthase [Thermoprotei archaeon]|nr:MAG: pseudouridine synthase [Thermoprotei archaeon]